MFIQSISYAYFFERHETQCQAATPFISLVEKFLGDCGVKFSQLRFWINVHLDNLCLDYTIRRLISSIGSHTDETSSENKNTELAQTTCDFNFSVGWSGNRGTRMQVVIKQITSLAAPFNLHRICVGELFTSYYMHNNPLPLDSDDNK